MTTKAVRARRRLTALPDSSVVGALGDFFRSSPGRLLVLAGILIATVMFVGWYTSAGQLARTETFKDTLADAEPRANSSQMLYSSLSSSNTAANAAFISGGVEPADLRNDYLTAVATAGRSLVTSAVGLPADDGQARDDLNQISMLLPTYTGLVEQARSNNRIGNPVGVSYLAEATAMMQSRILPAAERLYSAQIAGLHARKQTSIRPQFAIFACLALAVATLTIAHRFLAKRTNRLLNPGLLLAIVCISVALIWVLASGIASVAYSARADSRGAQPFNALTNARIDAQKARSDETMALVRRTGASAAQFDAALMSMRSRLDSITDAPSGVQDSITIAREAGEAWGSAHQRIETRQEQGDYTGATVLAIGSGPNTASAQYIRLDAELTSAIEESRSRYRDDINSARALIAYSGPISFALACIAALGIIAGFTRRIQEYR